MENLEYRSEMKNIFVIDKATQHNLASLDIIPRKGDRILIRMSEDRKVEALVECVLHDPEEHTTWVFVDTNDPYYSLLTKEINR